MKTPQKLYGKEPRAILWQEKKDDGLIEKAIVIEIYEDCLTLVQDGQEIIILHDCVEPFIKMLRMAKVV